MSAKCICWLDFVRPIMYADTGLLLLVFVILHDLQCTHRTMNMLNKIASSIHSRENNNRRLSLLQILALCDHCNEALSHVECLFARASML